MSHIPSQTAAPSFAEAFRTFARIGLLSFGGPAGQIALMHKVLVDEKKWIDEARFLHALNFCMLLPGPEAQQLACYMGWVLHGLRGGIMAGVLFVLPGLAIILGLSLLYSLFSLTTWLPALFFGLKAAVLAVVIEALLRMGRKVAGSITLRLIAACSFLLIYAFGMPFPLIVLGAALFGLLSQRLWPQLLPQSGAGGEALPTASSLAAQARRSGLGLIVGLGLWALPGLVLALVFGTGIMTDISLFFSKMAVVTFGGAYAVLSYVAQEAVSKLHWLKPGEMLDGLALAETTPGPLILVLCFVGYLAAFRTPPAGMESVSAGILGLGLTAWVTFVPSMLWVLLGAPYMERLRGNKALGAALQAITGAVAGVILNLTVWFALHVLFADVGRMDAGPLHVEYPRLASLDVAAALLSAGAMLALFRFGLGMVTTLALCCIAGVVMRLVLG